MAPSLSISAVILAGGRGSRMGDVDKGLQPFRGRALVEWVLERIEPQVDDVLISANRNLERYLALGYPVVRDRIAEFAGPLAGLHAALSQARSDLIVTVPCDSPFLPHDLVQRLAHDLQSHDVAVARTTDRLHPVFSLCRVGLLEHLHAYLAGGGRRFETWCTSLDAVEVAFDDQSLALANVNTLSDLEALERSDER